METIFIKVDPNHPDPLVISAASEIIKAGGVVGFPTETVYGLGADALNPDAVDAIFLAKGRPSSNPVILHIASFEDLEGITIFVPDNARKLMDAFWPGPLTVVLEKTPNVPDNVTGGLQTVAVRMPSHPVALALIKASGTPIAAPSANISGVPSTTMGDHVLEDMDTRIPMILDCGPCDIGVESTVVDFTQDPPVILRPGGLSAEDIRRVIPAICSSTERKEKSPGTRFKHYSPKAQVVLIPVGDLNKTDSFVVPYLVQGLKVLLVHHYPIGMSASDHLSIRYLNPDDYARNIFSILRNSDKESFDVVVIQGVAPTGLGVAVMDRLHRASVKT